MPNMGDGVELKRYLLNREIVFWTEEGRDRTGGRIVDLPADSHEAKQEHAWEEHCLKRANDAAFELTELDRGQSSIPDAEVVHIEDWRNRDS
jgi:hypothetical protein